MKFGEVVCEESIAAYRVKLMDRELSQNTIDSYITAVRQYQSQHAGSPKIFFDLLKSMKLTKKLCTLTPSDICSHSISCRRTITFPYWPI